MTEDLLPVLRGESARRIFGKYELKAVYLFGSHARECADAQSDIDIAVLFASGGDAAQRFQQTTALQLDLKSLLPGPIDIVSLNDANPLVAFEAVCRGKDIYAGDEDERIFYELALRHRYDEFRHIQDIFTKALSEKLKVS